MNIQSSNHKVLLADALATIRKMRSQLEALEAAKIEPIAIIGMDCQFPQAKHPEGYWQLLHNGIDAITEIPSTRWDISQYYHPEPSQPGKMYSRHGAFLDCVDRFDPHFLGISPLEATGMDPQQRLLLEVSYHALENAGQSLDQLKGSKTGVFVGICFDDYAKLSFKGGNVNNIDAYTSLGNSKSIAVGRLSYLFGFTGPALSLDTSCSSSLLAIHLACQSLRNRESHLALAGGVNLMLSPEVSIGFSKLRALSPSGRCKTFDASADGYVRGEGCGIVVLKRLSDAVADGDRILALIRGSAANQDGRSNGLTAPNGLAQEAVMNQALAEARLHPHQIQYVEAHGTGTSLGDPIEVSAVNQVLCRQRSSDNPLYLGSVKTNFGHLEGAAGVAGLMKVVLALQNQEIPPHLHLETPNPYIPWSKIPLRIPTEPTPWLSHEDSRYASVSSFGMSGTNVHIVLEEAKPPEYSDFSRPHQLLLLSAKTSSALETVTQNLEKYLQSKPNVQLADVAYTLSKGRQAYSYRKMFVVSAGQEIVNTFPLKDYLDGREGANPPAVVFMFSGQGSQYVNMGLDLYQTEPLFRQQIDRCAELLQPYIGKDLRQILYPPTSTPDMAEQLRQTEITQCALFVVEYALAQLWMSWGVKPVALVGHSIGEYVAACLSGVFSLEDALFLVAKRGQLMQQMPPGQMLALMTDESTVRSLMEDFILEQRQQQEVLSLAVINSSSQYVVSGATSSLAAFQKYCTTQGLKGRLLNTSHGFHSHMMDPIVPEFVQLAQRISLNPPQIPYLSNVTGTWISQEQAIDPYYWGRHLRSCVRFADNLQELSKKPDYFLLEVGPGQTLSQLAKRQKIQQPAQISASLPPSLPPSASSNYPSLKCLLTTLGQLWLTGVNINWQRFYEGQNRQILSLPSYPFERQRYWIDTEPSLPEVQTPVNPGYPSPKIPLTSHQERPSALTSSYVSPGTQTEKYITQILEESLGIHPIGIEDNFFELGGDSLLAIQIISRISQEFKVKLNQSQLIETPTITKLALLIDEGNEKGNSSQNSSLSPLVKIQASGSQPPLFLIHPAGGSAFSYLNFGQYLDPNQPIYGIEDPGLYQNLNPQSFPDKARSYLDIIRSVQPHGPYQLAGYSYGGNMALEMAIQFNKAGETVEFLGMLDSFPPSAYENIFIDNTRLLAALWHMTGLLFDKQPRDWLAELQQVEANQQINYVIRQLLEDTTGIPLPSTFVRESTLMVAMNNFRQLHHYSPPESYTGQITYFWAEEKIPTSLSRLLNYQIPDDLINDGWGKLVTQPIKTYFVPGNHFTMFNPSNLPSLAQQFQRALKVMSIR